MQKYQRSARGFDQSLGNNGKWFDEMTRGRYAGPVSPQQVSLSSDRGEGTLCVHAGTYHDPVTGAVGTPIFQTTTFDLADDSYAAFHDGTFRDIPIYSRYGNPNQWVIQEKISALEGAESGVVAASGMGAISAVLLGLSNQGSHVVSSYDVYGGTYNFLREDMFSAGRETTFVDGTDLQAVAAAIRPSTQILFFETISNPLLKLLPLEGIARIAREANALLVIDNTFTTPLGCRPIEKGAHVVVHSATKYLGGHSDVTAGVAAGKRKYLDRVWAQMMRSGAPLDPFACFLLERGMKTLEVRFRRQCANAKRLAEVLQKSRNVSHVFYPGLNVDDKVDAAAWGAMVSFEVAGDHANALQLMDRLKLACVATSLGGVETLVSMPANSSHSSLTRRQRDETGISDTLIRVSLGIEDIEDILDDFCTALNSLNTPGDHDD